MQKGKRRSNGQLVRDRRRIADLYLQGWIQADIADELQLDQSTISRDLKHLYKEWQQSSLIDIDEAKSQELAKVDRLEREYWIAWVNSCEDAETLRQEGSKTETGKVKPDKIVKTAKGQAGDPRFLSGVQWCINKRCEILGLDAAIKQDITSGGEILKGYTIVSPDDWDDDED
jgi:hypothetical protein